MSSYDVSAVYANRWTDSISRKEESNMQVFIPLRSNVYSSGDQALEQDIRSRIKLALLIYDNVVVEDGAYSSSIINDEFLFQSYIPPSKLNFSRRMGFMKGENDSNYMKMMIRPSGSFEPMETVIEGPAVSMRIDFYHILQELHNLREDCIQWVQVDDSKVPNELQQTFAKADTDSIKELAEFNRLNRDIAVGNLLEASLLVDPHHHLLLEAKRHLNLPEHHFLPDVDYAVAHNLVRIRVPDLDKLSFEEVLDLRSDQLWNDFRGGINLIAQKIWEEPTTLTDEQMFRDAVNIHLSRAIFEETDRRAKSYIDLAGDTFMAFFSILPFVGYAATAWSLVRSGSEYSEHRQGWIGFIDKVKKASEQIK